MDYLYQRRRGLAKTAGVVSGIYVLGRYVSHRLDTMRGTFVEERAAQDKCVLIPDTSLLHTLTIVWQPASAVLPE
jgi:hypothetical protein